MSLNFPILLGLEETELKYVMFFSNLQRKHNRKISRVTSHIKDDITWIRIFSLIKSDYGFPFMYSESFTTEAIGLEKKLGIFIASTIQIFVIFSIKLIFKCYSSFSRVY